MLGQFTGQQKPDSSLDLPGGDGGSLVVVSKTGSFSSDTFEDIVDEGVHDAHGLGGHTGIGVDLFQDLVDVDGIRFLTLLGALLIFLGTTHNGSSGLLGSLSRGFGGHVDRLVSSVNLMLGAVFPPLLYKSTRSNCGSREFLCSHWLLTAGFPCSIFSIDPRKCV